MMVSIVIITYAHENYIRAAIEGVLMQQCDFPFELIVSNDASPDKTDAVMEDIIKTHPQAHKISYTHHRKNLGMMGNFLWALNQAKGKYVALCEGDDYWTDPNKLQMQVEFMEAHPDYAMCYHPVEITMSNDKDHYAYPIPTKDTLLLKDIIQHHYIPTCSLVFRNSYFLAGYPEWFRQSISGDIPLEILLAAKGKTKYLPKSMACYRRNEGGISQSPVQVAKIRTGYIFMYSKLAAEIKLPDSLPLYRKILRLRLSLLKSKLLNGLGAAKN